ncbi:MAG: ribose 5-phosphate isomerase B [Desulfobulbaceae bacterium]|nr:ribose 5-phosphate isomerase B [Desulfobulbaceae bacterium]
MKIGIGSDHGGFALKEHIIAYLTKEGYEVIDVGNHGEASVDYPDFANKLCLAMAAGDFERGILICGTGIGMSMAANRHRHIRAALCQESFSARMSREHNNANVLCLGGRVLGVELAKDIVSTWLHTDFAGGRHQNRIARFC